MVVLVYAFPVHAHSFILLANGTGGDCLGGGGGATVNQHCTVV